MQREQNASSYFDQVLNAFEPWARVNNVMFDNMQKAIQFQLETMQRYSHLGTEQLKVANGLRSIGDAQHYGDLFGSWVDQMMGDFRTMTDLSMEFRDELSKAFSVAGSQVAHQVEDLSNHVNEASKQIVDKAIDKASEAAGSEIEAATKEATEKNVASASSKSTASRSRAESTSSRQGKSRA
ncbi:phasin family protein [Halomonas sp. McH1-25]|uniref:phasin family protein n=1 Tax=unclassified Halomonas TaxID=2609666 RepID=UPI001EF635A3|nr:MULTISPECIES: phasin family protein [unclassified Halomonas]MCG7600897.1 phasin family protein [Halomonas sp. McH1-25]MCP1341485.1 phasin family protein [Halomonas sp. FL8]MCP1360076.1 phasin family protein [Halomonas sp. BBD45]MCP1364236.1 phasin family protein [Halomonas sp. BBD48]